MGSRGVAMFLQWVARRPDPSRKRCYAGVLLGAHIHTVALTTVSNCNKFVMVHYTCLVQGTNFCRCHLIRHTSLRWAPFLCIGTGICARFYVVFRFIWQRKLRKSKRLWQRQGQGRPLHGMKCCTRCRRLRFGHGGYLTIEGHVALHMLSHMWGHFMFDPSGR